MNDMYKECELNGVYKKVDDCLNIYMVELSCRLTEDSPVETKYVSFTVKRRLADELKEMMKGKRERVYASLGMTNVDFYVLDIEDGLFCIEWSPFDGECDMYFVKKDDMKRIADTVKVE